MDEITRKNEKMFSLFKNMKETYLTNSTLKFNYKDHYYPEEEIIDKNLNPVINDIFLISNGETKPENDLL